MELVIFSILGWGIAGVFGGILSRRASIASLMFWGPFLSAPLVIIPLLLGASLDQPAEVFLFVFLSYLSLTAAWSLYWRALRIGETSLVVSLGATYPLSALLLFLLFRETEATPLLLLGSFLISLGLFLIHLENKRSSQFPWKALGFGFGASLSWGLWSFFDWKSLAYASAADVILVFFLFSPLLPLVLLCFSRLRPLDLSIDGKTALLRFLLSISSTIALISLYYALEESGNPAITISLAATYPLATFLFLLLLKKEKWRKLKVAAILVTVFGVAVLQVYQHFNL